MPSNLATLVTEGISPSATAPGERRLEGEPNFTLWGVTSDEDGSLVTGIWETTPGKWRVEYRDKWEFCTIVAGELHVTEEGGPSVVYRAGDSFVLRDGFTGVWEAPVPTRKHYVVRFPKRA